MAAKSSSEQKLRETFYGRMEKLNHENNMLKSSAAFVSFQRSRKMKSAWKNHEWKKVFALLKERWSATKAVTGFSGHIDRLEKDMCQIDVRNSRIALVCFDELSDHLMDFDDFECFLVSDRHQEVPEGWNLVVSQKEDPEGMELDYLRFHPEFFLQGFDYALLVSKDVRIVSDITGWINRISLDSGLALYNHSTLDDAYALAKQDAQAHENGKDIQWQMKLFRNTGFPRHFGLNDLRIMAVDLHHKQALNLLDAFWQQKEQTPLVPQTVLWPYVVWENGGVIEEIGNLGNYIEKDDRIDICPISFLEE